MWKKIIVTSISSIFLIGLGIFAWGYFTLEAIEGQYLDLKEGEEERIVLVNIGNGDRKYIAEKIDEVAACYPLLIGIDVFFGEYDSASTSDNLLLNSIQNSKSILGTRHGGIGTHGVHPTFHKIAGGYGFAELSTEDGYVANWEVFYDLKNQRDYHFAFTIANKIDSIAASNFVNSLHGSTSDVVISRLSNQFKVFDFEDAIDCELIAGKTVIFGYLGPTSEDKFKTYARYYDNVEGEGPDMYGPIIVANQVLMILNEQ